MARFRIGPDQAGAARAQGGRAFLDEAESHHLARVLRIKPGSTVTVFDGLGAETAAKVIGPPGADGRVEIEMAEEWRRPAFPGPRIALACAWPKGKRAVYLVEKCTELGVAEIAPVLFLRSVVKPAAGSAAASRWRKIAESAARQCGRADVPDVADPAPLSSLLARKDAFGFRFAALVPEPGAPPAALPRIERGAPVLCLVGPEGGFSPDESRAALAAGFLPFHLGPHTLRVETAAAAACALLMRGTL